MYLNFSTIAALTLWPIVSLVLFASRPAISGLLWTILGAQLLLPVGAAFKVPGVPQFDKATLGNVTALAGVWLFSKAKPKLNYGFGWVELLLLLFVTTPFVTSLLNNDFVVLADGVIPSLGAYDGLSAMAAQALMVIPFVLGRSILRSPAANNAILSTLCIAGLLFSIGILIEVKFSPQLHIWIYGYFPSEFYQEVRAGGFRPVVFMGHGLVASFFLMTTVVAATAIWRTQKVLGSLPLGPITAYLALILLLCKSAGAALMGAILSPLVKVSSPTVQIRIAMLLTTIALGYPIIRASNLLPTRDLVAAAASTLGPERADSLNTRFQQEEQLLGRALQKPVFGWGRWGRSRIYSNELDKDISITDGRWIITLGQFGIIGFVAEFGLLGIGVFRARSAIRSIPTQHSRLWLTALGLIVAANIFELLPNSTLMPWTFLLAGALVGRSENAILLATRANQRTRDRPLGGLSAPSFDERTKAASCG